MKRHSVGLTEVLFSSTPVSYTHLDVYKRQVFAYPGLGTLSFESAMYKDYNMLMALTVLTGAVVLLFNLAAQLLSEFIDPRTGYEEPEGEAI